MLDTSLPLSMTSLGSIKSPLHKSLQKLHYNNELTGTSNVNWSNLQCLWLLHTRGFLWKIEVSFGKYQTFALVSMVGVNGGSFYSLTEASVYVCDENEVRLYIPFNDIHSVSCTNPFPSIWWELNSYGAKARTFWHVLFAWSTTTMVLIVQKKRSSATCVA